LIQEGSKRSNNRCILFKIAAAACYMSGFWRFIFQQELQDCHSAHDTLVLWHKYFTK